MSADHPEPGRIAWTDLTVEDADGVRDFYQAVVGWTVQPVDMAEGYQDWALCTPESGEPVAGVCHARGPNAGLPPVWLVYVNVADLDASLAACRARGGEVLRDPRELGSYGRVAVIRDPAGATLALIEPPRGGADGVAAGGESG